MFYVIGSGPSGIAAAAALLDAGRPVTMLDVGETCAPGPLEAARRLAATPRSAWSETDLGAVRGPSYFADQNRPLKRAYGSTFAYALDEMDRDAQDGTRCVQSFARGGLSNVWGAAVLPARAADLHEWPFGLDALEAGYAAVAQLMPVAGVSDGLTSDYPFYAPPRPGLRPSRQAVSLLDRLTAHRESLRRDGINFGRSRLAVRSVPDADGEGCQYTGLCLTGCPYFAIWTADQALDRLRQRRHFTYRAGWRVDAVLPAGSAPTTIVATGADGQQEQLPASRVLLACGPLATARIVLHSLRAYDRPVTLRYQPYFLVPMLASRVTTGVEGDALHTLAQLFLEISAPDVSPFTVHLQIYTFNTLVEERLRSALRVLGPLNRVARQRLVGRLLPVQGYLHSAHAQGMSLTARNVNARPRLELRADAPPADAVHRVLSTIRKHRTRLGATPLTPLLEIGQPGDGNHCGGSFPMRTSPGSLETDLSGQLHDLPGVHLVDSSVLPSLPATTFTYTVMANAYRIGLTVARLHA